MATLPRRLGQRQADIEREEPLREVVRLDRIEVHDLAQRPLQEEQKADRQDEPASGGDKGGDEAVGMAEPASGHADTVTAEPGRGQRAEARAASGNGTRRETRRSRGSFSAWLQIA